jgi:hypothetical protein
MRRDPKRSILRDPETIIGALVVVGLFAIGFWWGGWFWH